MLEIDSGAEFSLSENIVLRVLPDADQYYAFDVKNGDHFSLNSTAHWVLERIGRNEDFASLLTDFEKEFDLKREEALRDLTKLMEFALENKIIIRRHCHEGRQDV